MSCFSNQRAWLFGPSDVTNKDADVLTFATQPSRSDGMSRQESALRTDRATATDAETTDSYGSVVHKVLCRQ